MEDEEIKAIEKDRECKAIRFYKSFIEAQEKELYWMEKEDEEYYKDDIEEKQLLIKGFKAIQNVIEKQKAEIEKKDKIIHLMAKYFYNTESLCVKDEIEVNCKHNCIKCIKEYFENKVKESK